jgi:predicted small metal-binding protein
MGKIIECQKVNPAGDCNHVVRGADEQEVLRNASFHAKEHGLEPTPELMEQIKRFITEEDAKRT